MATFLGIILSHGWDTEFIFICTWALNIKLKLEFVFYMKTDVSPLLEWCSFVQSQILVQQRGINSESM